MSSAEISKVVKKLKAIMESDFGDEEVVRPRRPKTKKRRDIIEGEVVPFKRKGTDGPKGPEVDEPAPTKISLTQAFGPSAYNYLKDLGYPMVEKPSLFSEIYDRRHVPLRIIREMQLQMGRRIPVFKPYEVFTTSGPRPDIDFYPQSDAKDVGENIILEFDGKMFFAARGARTYYRFWCPVSE